MITGGAEDIARVWVLCNRNYMPTEKREQAAHPLEQIGDWFARRLPREWFVGTPEVVIDREEITVIGHLPSTAGVTAATGDKRAGKAPTAAAGTAEPSRPRGQAAATGRRRQVPPGGREARAEIARGGAHTVSPPTC